MTIIKNDISPKDLARIGQLRELVQDDLTPYYNTDFNLLRWLQGHHALPIEQIAKKMRFHLKLRKSSWQLDSMGGKPRTHAIHKHWAHGITGFSGVMDNVIVNIEQCGRTDYNGMMECYSLSEIMKARVPDLEEMLAMCMEQEKKTGKQAWILYVMDITGLEYNRKLYDLVTGSMRALAEFMADHYVELIKFFVPVALPSFAAVMYTVVRPLLPERTRDKVRLLSANEWKTDLLSMSCVESLPSLWNDDKHSFPAVIQVPLPYPVDKYYAKLERKAPTYAKRIEVPAGKNHFEVFHLETGDRITWWISGNRDMGHGFFRCKCESENEIEVMDQVTPAFTCMPGPTIVPLEESLTIEKSGVYKMWYGNRTSWWFVLTVQSAIMIEKKKN